MNQPRPIVLSMLAFLAFSIASFTPARAQDLNDYKFKVSGDWWYAQPSGKVFGRGNQGYFNLQKDFGFGYYTTFDANFDWRFKRKQHLLFGISPVDNSRTATLQRTINFEGNTYNVGTQATAEIKTVIISPGYEYDFISRNHGDFGATVVAYMIDSTASLTGTVTVNGQNAIKSVSDSTFVPVPVLGVRGRWFPTNSKRLSFEGWVQGMYFFGYGNIWAARGVANIGIFNHVSLDAGYLLGDSLSVHGTNDRVGLLLRQKGAVVGIQGTW